jgi:phospholipid/cholesterol/gamma-HCH transport system ATP-binding protein
MDELIVELRDGLGATVVIVSHEFAILFSICDDGIFLDAEARKNRRRAWSATDLKG